MEPLPKLELDDILSRPGTLRRTSSWGSMISDSISLGADARHDVRMEISGRSISGVIWIGRRIKLRVPKITTRMPATMTATGFPNDIRVKVKALSFVYFLPAYRFNTLTNRAHMLRVTAAGVAIYYWLSYTFRQTIPDLSGS